MRILAATDFTEGGNNAVAYAAALASAMATPLHLAHAFKAQSSAATVFKGLNEVLENDAREALEGLKLALKGEFPTLTIELHVAYGHATDVVMRLAQELNADLVITGSRGKSLLDGLFFGSISHELINQIRFPLMLIPPGSNYKTGGELLFATALRDTPTAAQLDLLQKLASAQQNTCRLLHVFDDDYPVTPEQEARYQALKEALQIAADARHLYFHEDIMEGILEETARIMPNCLVLQQYQYNLLEKFLMPSVKASLIRKTKLPILLLPAWL